MGLITPGVSSATNTTPFGKSQLHQKFADVMPPWRLQRSAGRRCASRDG